MSASEGTASRRGRHGEYLILIYEDEQAYASRRRSCGSRSWRRTTGSPSRSRSRARRSSAARRCSRPAPRPASAATSVTDGPFAETKEALGGYYLIEAADLDQALAIAQALPGPFGGVEVRPIMDLRREPVDRGDDRRGRTSAAAVADAHRREWAFVLAATVRVARDLDLAEECVQDAYAAALDALARATASRHARRLADDDGPAAGARRAAAATQTLRAQAAAAGRDPTVPGRTRAARRARGGRGDPGRPAAAGLHLLPPRAGPGGPGGADPAAGLRAHHRRDGAARSW